MLTLLGGSFSLDIASLFSLVSVFMPTIDADWCSDICLAAFSASFAKNPGIKGFMSGMHS
jgi:hypothetical protein